MNQQRGALPQTQILVRDRARRFRHGRFATPLLATFRALAGVITKNSGDGHHMKINHDPEVYQSCEAAFLEAMGRSIKVCIDQSEIGTAAEREALFMALLAVVASRCSGFAIGSTVLSGSSAYPVMGYARDDDGVVYFGKGSRLHELVAPLAAALAGVAPKVFVIDGFQFSTLDGFFDEISRKLIPGAHWGRNLDAFNDILGGGFGTPEEGFVLRWTNSARSRETLGYPETVRCLDLKLQKCHPANREDVARALEMAKTGVGPTVFDWLVDIIGDHGAGGKQAVCNVRLILQ